MGIYWKREGVRTGDEAADNQYNAFEKFEVELMILAVEQKTRKIVNDIYDINSGVKKMTAKYKQDYLNDCITQVAHLYNLERKIRDSISNNESLPGELSVTSSSIGSAVDEVKKFLH